MVQSYRNSTPGPVATRNVKTKNLSEDYNYLLDQERLSAKAGSSGESLWRSQVAKLQRQYEHTHNQNARLAPPKL